MHADGLDAMLDSSKKQFAALRDGRAGQVESAETERG
jgi:hypothetical protein